MTDSEPRPAVGAEEVTDPQTCAYSDDHHGDETVNGCWWCNPLIAAADEKQHAYAPPSVNSLLAEIQRLEAELAAAQTVGITILPDTTAPQLQAPASLRRSHFASGWDAAQTRLEAEVQRLQGELEKAVDKADFWEMSHEECHEIRVEIADDLARVTAERDALREVEYAARHYLQLHPCECFKMLPDALARLDAAQQEAKPSGVERARGALSGQKLLYSPEEAIRRVRDGSADDQPEAK